MFVVSTRLSHLVLSYFLMTDCYVAAVGLPAPRHDHAVAMCRFARDILKAMAILTKDLEIHLGPDTGGT